MTIIANEDAMIREGGCLCGAVRFRCEGEPLNVRICHCRNCQKAMGSPFYARALFPQGALSVTGETARYASSEAIDRVFCKICGTRLFTRRRNGTADGVALATFDDPNAFAPTVHMWVSQKIGWVKLDDGLPQHQGTVPP
jgi:hypothetical protein